MSIDKTLLKRLRILYVEDDSVVRSELELLLSEFFGKVFTACDGKEGLETYFKHKDEIDVILTDINMPKLSGLDMVKEIKDETPNIPVFLATAHSDTEFLAEAIKLKVQEYLIKPVDIRHLLNMMSDLANVVYQDVLLEKQTKELERYKEIIDSNNIVVKTDVHMNITYVNELFCQITSYDKSELIGKEFKSLKHPDNSNDIYTKMYASVLHNKPWHGVLKNLTKMNTAFTTDCHMITTLDDAGEITGAISIQRDITEELHKKRDIQLALMKDKSDIFIRSKEGTAEQHIIINELKHELDISKQELTKSRTNNERFIYSVEKYTVENRNLRTELSSYKKNTEKHNLSLKLSKENADLSYQIKKQKNKIDDQDEKYEKDIKQLKVNNQIEIDDLEGKLRVLNEKYEAIETDDIIMQKLEYWKEKAKIESNRVESLEKQIIAHGDENFMSKIFG